MLKKNGQRILIRPHIQSSHHPLSVRFNVKLRHLPRVSSSRLSKAFHTCPAATQECAWPWRQFLLSLNSSFGLVVNQRWKKMKYYFKNYWRKKTAAVAFNRNGAGAGVYSCLKTWSLNPASEWVTTHTPYTDTRNPTKPLIRKSNSHNNIEFCIKKLKL